MQSGTSISRLSRSFVPHLSSFILLRVVVYAALASVWTYTAGPGVLHSVGSVEGVSHFTQLLESVLICDSRVCH